MVGKPVALMNKGGTRSKAIQFLNNSGAFLITKSGDKVCKFFGISKYTLYSYIDEAKGGRQLRETETKAGESRHSLAQLSPCRTGLDMVH